MRRRDLLKSSYFRYLGLVICLFAAAFIVAASIAVTTISETLDERVRQTAELASIRYRDIYEQSGVDALVETVRQDTERVDREDTVIWFGTASGEKLAGQAITEAASLQTGQARGHELGSRENDIYLLTARDMDGFRLITGQSLEESDALKSILFGGFGLTFMFTLMIAGIGGLIIARRGQLRLTQISDTLDRVASGDLDARIREANDRDDLGRLCGRINSALGTLKLNIEGMRRVSTDIAHDLRTPINRLGIELEAVESRLGRFDETSQEFDRIRTIMRDIIRTFDALLRIAQIEAGARKAKFQAVPLADVVADIAEAYSAVADDNGQTLSVSSPARGSSLIFGDRELLTQLTANLVENAIHHAGAGAGIRLETGSGLQGVWLSVADTGPGIPQAEHTRVFDRFYRMDQSRTTPGTGLGLALVKAISDLHEADIQIMDGMPGLVIRIGFQPFNTALRDND